MSAGTSGSSGAAGVLPPVDRPGRPVWLSDQDELPHPLESEMPGGWSENYLTYVWSPREEVGIYIHLSRRVAPFDLWDEIINIALPGDRFVTAKAFGPGATDSATVNAVHMSCTEPYRTWSIQLNGAGRVLDGDSYRSGPVADGPSTPLRAELKFEAMGPAFDFGTEHLDQAWGHGHYEQHGRIVGWIEVGHERFEIGGTGLRDHSWGPRDYREIGTTTWLHAQFPESGRTLMAVVVTGRPPRPPFSVAAIAGPDSVRHLRASGLPLATTLEETGEGFDFVLHEPDGAEHAISVAVITPLRAACVGPDEMAVGTYDSSSANHHYIDAFSRFVWDGEVGHGVVERTVDLTTH